MRPSFYEGPGPRRWWWDRDDWGIASVEQARLDRKQQRWETCIHESGHACAYISHGIEVVDLVALRTAAHPDWRGYCRTRYRGAIPAEVNVICSLGGQAADKIFFNLSPDPNSADGVEAMAEAVKLNPGNPRAELDRAWHDALRLVDHHYDAIEKVARSLMYHGALPPADIDEVLGGTTVEIRRRAVERIRAILNRGASSAGRPLDPPKGRCSA